MSKHYHEHVLCQLKRPDPHKFPNIREFLSAGKRAMSTSTNKTFIV
jgi:hypothetical protein